MGLHDRIKGPNGNGANGNGNGAEPHAALTAATPRDAGADRSSVDPYAELKTRIHHACIAKLGPQLFSSAEPTGDLSDQVMRTVTEQLARVAEAAAGH